MIAWIDPLVKYVSTEKLHSLNKATLSTTVSVVTSNGQPVAVVIPYRDYLELQACLELPKSRAANA